MECLIFDIKGEFAHFKKFYTTTSPLTFFFPPRTAVSGLIGSILGIERRQLPKCFSESKAHFVIQIICRPQKMVIKENWRKGVARLSRRGLSVSEMQDISQIPLEVLRFPHYRVFFHSLEKNFLDKLEHFLIEKKSVYTPCLGLSEFICEVEFIERADLKPVQVDSFVDITSVINEKIIDSIQFEDGKEYVDCTVPQAVDQERRFKYARFIVEKNGGSIKIKPIPTARIYEYHSRSERQYLTFLEA